MTPEQITRMHELQSRALQGVLGEDDSRELVRLRRILRGEIEQSNALEKFNEASTVWRVSLRDFEDDAFPFYTLRRLSAEREMAYWGLGDLMVLEEIDRASVKEKLRYLPSGDCYIVEKTVANQPETRGDVS